MVQISLTVNEVGVVLDATRKLVKRDDITGLLATNIQKKLKAALRRGSSRKR